MNKINFNFDKRTAVITGGAQGFGLDIAKRFLNSGAKVIIWDIDPIMIEKSTKDLNNSNLRTNIVDVSIYKQVEKDRQEYEVLNKNNNQDEFLKYLGDENVVDLTPRMTAEDFSYYSQLIPSCFYRLGTANVEKKIINGLHTSKFNIDEEALRFGMGLMAYLAIRN